MRSPPRATQWSTPTATATSTTRTPRIVAFPEGAFFAEVIADDTGTIRGENRRSGSLEAHWGGLQIAVAQ